MKGRAIVIRIKIKNYVIRKQHGSSVCDTKNMSEITKKLLGYSRIVITVALIVGLVAVNFGVFSFVKESKAANIAKLSDTMTDTDTSVSSNHTISFITQSTTTGSGTIIIDFPDSFKTTTSPAFANTDPLDYDISTTTGDEIAVYAAGSCPGAGNTAFEITSISSANVFTFTHCAGTEDLNAYTTTTIKIGTNATTGGTGDSQLFNPDETGTQRITVTNGSDSATTHVFIIDDVVLTAAVDTTFEFTISGVNSGQAKCSGTTDETSSATTLPFGTMSAGVSKILAQDLTVQTNARNGHVVTIQQNQNPLSSTGADIDVFDDGTSQTTPATWSAPQGQLDSEETYGHYGFTSEDTDLNGGEFNSGGQKFAGFDGVNTPDEIFSHTGPSDGTTADKGATSVCYQMEVSTLQEAANDYTNEITYIATPTF